MKKITLLIVVLIASWQMNAQFGCGSAVVLTNGYTATGITTPGTGGIEDWNDNPTDTSPLTSPSYWDDDVYLYTYTAGATPEEVSMTILSINSWNGIGIFANCSGTLFSGHITSVGATGANVSKTVTANIAANQTVYIAIGQWGTPNGLNFNVTSFSAIPLVNPPSCVTITSPVDMAVNISSSVISWPAAAGAATDYILKVGTTSGGTDVLNNISVGNVLTYNIGSLSAGTTYYVTVTPSNSNGVASSCTETSFTTCAEVTEFTENFDGYTSTGFSSIMQNCWSKAGTGSTYVNTGAVAPMSPSNRLYMFASGTVTPPTEGYAILPAVSNLQANTHRLKFKAYSSSGTDRVIVVGYLTNPTDITTFIQLEEINIPGTTISNTQEFIVTPIGVPAGVKNLSIRNPGYPGGSTNAYIDDVVWEAIPACSNPTNISFSGVTSSTATINWTGNPTDVSWEIEYGAPGFTVGSGTTVAAATNPFTLTGLMPQTNYQFYVRAVCAGPSTSSNSIPSAFLTACVPVTTLPWNENFDALTTVGTNSFPPCWVKENGDWATATTDVYATPNSGPNLLRNSWSATNEYIWTPQFALVAGTSYDFSGFVQGDDGTGWVVDFFVNDVQNSIGATQLGATYNVPGTGTSYIANGYVNVKRTFVPTTTGVYSFGIRVNQPSGSPWFVSFDDFQLKVTPAAAPGCTTNLVAVPNSCGNFASTLNWDAEASANGYYINIGTTTGGTDIANNVDVSTNTYSFIGTPNTLYYWTVTPYNTIGTASGCVEQSFTTAASGCACLPVYTDGTTDGDLISNVVITGTTLSNNSGNTAGGPSYTFYTGQPNYTATLQAGSSYSIEVTVGTYGSQNVAVWIDYNDDLTFDASEKVGFTTSSINANGTATFTISLACNPTLGLHRMRIRDVFSTSGSSIDPCISYGWGETEDYDVTITAAVSCPQPSNLGATNITAIGANLTWNIGCAETMWDLHLTTSGGGAPTGTPSNPNVASPFVATGLTAATAYEFYVRADCQTNGTSLWTGPFPFTTAVLPPANDECASAQALTPGGIFAINQLVGTNVGATNSNETVPGCASYLGGDVWYSVVVPASGSLTFEVNSNSGGITDAAGAVYSGVCGSLVLINCDDSSSTDPNDQPLITVTGQTPGSVLYFRVWEYGNNSFGTFLVSAYDATLSTSSFENSNFSAYPNPVNDVLNLTYSSDISSVSVFNLLGQEVIFRKINTSSTKIDMSDLSAGAYIVNVNVDGAIKTIKVIKQ